MVVFIQLHTVLLQHSSSGLSNLQLDIPSGLQVKDLIRSLNIDYEEISLIITINHRVVDEITILQEGDHVDLIPQMSGGCL